jgi:hypothetical protein
MNNFDLRDVERLDSHRPALRVAFGWLVANLTPHPATSMRRTAGKSNAIIYRTADAGQKQKAAGVTHGGEIRGGGVAAPWPRYGRGAGMLRALAGRMAGGRDVLAGGGILLAENLR